MMCQESPCVHAGEYVKPPVFTDYIELSIGGTLSLGGIGGTSYRYGVQVDNVLSLEVVTVMGSS